MADALLLANQVRTYEWGSRTVLPGLLGVPAPTEQPWAEIWIGAHPSDPSRLPDGRTLADVEPDLPFLVKLLAADLPLSIQAHPDRARAALGYAAEDAAGVPRDSGVRSYKDLNHKPELLVAITPAEALCGFSSPTEVLALAGRWGSPRWSALVADLAGASAGTSTGISAGTMPGTTAGTAADDGARLCAAFAGLVTMSGPDLVALLDEVVTTAGKVASQGASQDQRVAHWIARLADLHPGDPGVVAPLLLRLVALEPGEGLFVGPGVLHSYLHGAGVEVQASSDNVLRAGLTSKKVDLTELLQVVVGDHGPPPLVHPRSLAAGLDAYDVPVDDFKVWRVRAAAAPVRVPAAGPVIAVCVDGEICLGGAQLGPGSAAYLPSGAPVVTVTGSGTCFVTAAGARDP